MKPIQKTPTKVCSHKLSLALAALIAVAGASTPAASSKISRQLPGSKLVNVNVSLTMEIPMADESEQAMAAAQINGRKVLYRLATSECPVLLETIAETCRLTNLNVSTQIRRPNNANPVNLYVNGNAQFAISLKETE